MQPFAVPVLPTAGRTRPRTALVVSADGNFRRRLSDILTGLRWQIREAGSGAQAWTEAEIKAPEALIIDSWLPDLDHAEFLRSFRITFSNVDLIVANGTVSSEGARSPHRQELLYAVRRSQDTDTAIWNTARVFAADDSETPAVSKSSASGPYAMQPPKKPVVRAEHQVCSGDASSPSAQKKIAQTSEPNPSVVGERLPELVGNAACMLEVSRRIRLVASRMTPVLIEGPTGSGKEIVAEALHRLSARNRKPFVAINCAAIPEALLEAELFGHTRGAFTGAVQGRVGRIESADGGTLFLDEIGEMPLGLQAKLLRFVETGELQRVGDNETVKVDVRIVAATHRPLAELTQTNLFRADLYYRLAVFLIHTPALAQHLEDLPLLTQHFLDRLGRQMPVKRIDQSVLAKLAAHSWPGNVRELEHVLERGAILAGESPLLTAGEIDFGLAVN